LKSGKTFNKVETVSKKERLVELLKSAILAGELASGEAIVEASVAREFGVGQGVLREALIELQHQGFVQRTPYSGTRVTTLTHDDARHIYDLRIALEPLAFAHATPNIGDPALGKLKAIAERSNQACLEQDLAHQFQQQLAFRQLVWSLSGNHYLVRVLEQLVPPLFALYLIRATFSHSNREGLLRTITVAVESQCLTIEALERGNPEEVRAVVEGFLVQMRSAIGDELLSDSV
jgi:DNA-binding GntR family transcriptional regulator